MTPNGLARLKIEEGFKAKPYKDSRGFLSIGYGTNLEVGITTYQALALAMEQLADNAEEISRKMPWFATLSPARQDVIEDMCYQLGVSKVLQFRNMIGCITRQDWRGAAREMQNSDWFRQVPSRAEALAEAMVNG